MPFSDTQLEILSQGCLHTLLLFVVWGHPYLLTVCSGNRSLAKMVGDVKKEGNTNYCVKVTKVDQVASWGGQGETINGD